VDQTDRTQIAAMTANFRAANAYDLREVFAESAVYCMDE
jgi:hypothetical protein